VRNKYDLVEKRAISQQTEYDYCPPINAEHFYETSACSGMSVIESFEDVVENSKFHDGNDTVIIQNRPEKSKGCYP
jgi:hypothetical protein